MRPKRIAGLTLLRPYFGPILCAAALAIGSASNAAAAGFTDANWTALGPGLGGGYQVPSVNALQVSGSNLYVGGAFGQTAGSNVNNVAIWNGSAWLGMHSTLFNQVRAFALYGSNLYAGGLFSLFQSSGNRLSEWDGTNWNLVGTTPWYGLDGGVWSLARSGSDLYIGGFFTKANGTSASSIAKWDGGTNWSPLGSGVSFSRDVYALAVSDSNLYAGGSFPAAGGSNVNYVAKWDGTNWSPLGSGMNNWVYALAVSGSNLYAGGSFSSPAANIARWNGSTWSGLGSGMNGTVKVIAVSGGNVYAGGDFTTAGGTNANRIAKWDGTNWSPLGSGMNTSVLALAVSGHNLYAGGAFTNAGGKEARLVARAYLLPLPTLSVARSGSDVTVSWPSADTDDFTLEQATTVDNATNWFSTTATLNNDGTNRWVTVPAANQARFFRLRGP